MRLSWNTFRPGWVAKRGPPEAVRLRHAFSPALMRVMLTLASLAITDTGEPLSSVTSGNSHSRRQRLGEWHCRRKELALGGWSRGAGARKTGQEETCSAGIHTRCPIANSLSPPLCAVFSRSRRGLARGATWPDRVGTAEVRPGEVTRGRLPLIEYADGSDVEAPVIVIAGKERGPVAWFICCGHGDEFGERSRCSA